MKRFILVQKIFEINESFFSLYTLGTNFLNSLVWDALAVVNRTNQFLGVCMCACAHVHEPDLQEGITTKFRPEGGVGASVLSREEERSS